eukprot:CAMPEP_0178912602 /NCGR_PEP_ID=MMETSP0786-20121207/10364_1 /TAXON_ID=186022 /ORGANISM="Thalassionema frauenfeldii, Strain CCMP 1798" /LENGTH=483 /DNA_ID=CAMNT_0020585223 /DNA_START=162 /DNA_END=1613 /DNA_ORIENTATION=+
MESIVGFDMSNPLMAKQKTLFSLNAIPPIHDFIEPMKALSDALPAQMRDVDPILESEVFSTAAHVSLDLGTFIVPVTPLSIQLLAVVGRLFCIASDYIPDHAMLPEEFAYQVSMLAISSSALAQTLEKVLHAYRQTLTIRDRKCFASLFRPAGVTTMQFKMLMATALEWRELPSGSILTSDEVSTLDHKKSEEETYLYWLYDGELQVQSKGNSLQLITPKSRHLLGDLAFTASTCGRKKSAKSKLSVADSIGDDKFPKTTTTVKSEKATVLRVNTKKLKELMVQDQLLDQSIHNVLFDSMQDRISDLVLARQMVAREQEKRHRECFELLFQSTGVSWDHYKYLLSQSALELHHVAPGSIVASSHQTDSTNVNSENEHRYLQWVCEGELKLYTDTGRVLQTLAPATGHLFGDMNSSIVPSSLSALYKSVYSNSSVRVGGKDSVILRINALKMKRLADEDKSFELALQTLMYIQEERILSVAHDL